MLLERIEPEREEDLHRASSAKPILYGGPHTNQLPALIDVVT